MMRPPAWLERRSFCGVIAGLAVSLVACQHAVRTRPDFRPQPGEPSVNYDAVVYLLAAKKAERGGARVEAAIMWEAAVRAQENSPSLRLGLAQGLLAINRDSAALQAAAQSVRLDSTFADGHKFLAEYYRQRGDLARSAEHLEAVLRSRYDEETGWKLVHLYNGMGRSEESAHVLERLAERPEANPADILQWARIAENMGMMPSAEMLYRTHLRRWPENEPGVLGYAGFLDKHNRTEEAEAAYRQGLEARPRSSEIRKKLAWHLLGRQQWGQADSLMLGGEVAAQADLAEERAWVSLLLRYGQADVALRHAERVLSAFPDDPDLLVLLGQAHVARREYEEAAVAFGQAAARDSSVAAVTGLIYSQMHSERYAEAERSARAAIRRYPGDTRVKYLLGMAQRAQKDWAQAAETFGELTRLDPGDTDYLFNWASSLERIGRFDDAVAGLRRLLEREPRNSVALNYLGYMFAERGVHLDEALRLVTQAVAQEPKNPAYLDSMGWILYRLGRLAEARRFLVEAIEQDQTSATIYDHLGDVCAALGNRREAQGYWRQALSLEPENTTIRTKLNTHSRE